LENYRERECINVLPEELKKDHEDFEEVQDSTEKLEKKLEKLGVRLCRLRDGIEAEPEAYEDLFKSSRKELLRAKEKRDEVLLNIEEQLQLKRECVSEMKMIELESNEIEEAIKECLEDLDLINQYDVDLETKSVISLREMASSLDRDIEVLLDQKKNAVEEEQEHKAQLKEEQEGVDLQCDKLTILRKKEETLIVKSRDILKDFKIAFKTLLYAKIAHKKNSRPGRSIASGFFRRKQAPISNDILDLCRSSN